MLAIALLLNIGVGTAQADPALASGSDLLSQYKNISRQAEAAAEQMKSADADYRTATAARAKATRELDAANAELDKLSQQAATLRQRVNTLVSANYRGARTNRLYAVLTSDSPQQLLDQMSINELLSRQAADDVHTYQGAQQRLEKAKKLAQQRQRDADTAIAAVNKRRSDLRDKQGVLQVKAARVRAVYQGLTGTQLAALAGPQYDFNRNSLPKGTSVEEGAVLAALTRIGDPYVWGATGPHQFDCSGLMLWAYRQVGMSIPRTASQQEQGGKVVPREALQPGDLIIYYPDATHVGMYIGDGYVVHASTFGVPVKVVPIDKAGPYKVAVRY